MLIIHDFVYQSPRFKILYDQRVRRLDEHALPGLHSLHEFALVIHKLNERQVILSADLRVVLAEGGSGVDDAGTVIERNEIVMYHVICFLLGRGKIEERFVLHAEKL